MTVRPTTLPAKLWTKLDEKQRVAAAAKWDNDVSDSDKKDIKDEGDVAVAIDILMEAIDYNPAAKTQDKAMESPTPVSAMPSDVVAWIAAQKAKVTPELSTFVHDTVEMQLANDERKILLFERLHAAEIDVPSSGSEPDPTANTAAKRLGDVYYVSGKTLDSKPVLHHRVHDLADQLFGNGYLAEVLKLEGMGDEAVKDMGEPKYREDLGTARKKLSVLRKKFSEACDMVVAFRDTNTLAGVVVIVGNTKSPTPFQLRELTGKPAPHDIGRTYAVSPSELESYRPSVAKELFDGGTLKRAGSETEPGTMYDAVRASRPPKKPRKPGGSQNQTGTGAPQGNEVVIKNMAQYDSAMAELAIAIREPGFKAEWFNYMNAKTKDGAWANIDALVSNVEFFKWLDIQLQTDDRALLKRAGTEMDRRTEASKPPVDKAA